MRLFLIFFLLCINFNVYANSLTKEESFYFDFIDMNNDNLISLEEADQVIKLIYNLLDTNGDRSISKEEIINLKYIIESLS